MSTPSPDSKGEETTRAYFMRGLFFIVPIAVTLWLVGFTLNLADAWLGTAIRALVSLLLPDSSATLEAASWFGFAVSVTSVLALCGALVVAATSPANAGVRGDYVEARTNDVFTALAAHRYGAGLLFRRFVRRHRAAVVAANCLHCGSMPVGPSVRGTVLLDGGAY